jgi:hypothetical protein
MLVQYDGTYNLLHSYVPKQLVTGIYTMIMSYVLINLRIRIVPRLNVLLKCGFVLDLD